jgi:hypothetical protein
MNSNTLARRVAQRKKFVERVVLFVQKFAVECGHLTKREMGSSSCHVVWEARYFERLSFVADLGQTMFGGNDIVIRYHGPVAPVNSSTIVFSVHYQASLDDCEVKVFDMTTNWVNDLKQLMRNRSRVSQRVRKQKEVDLAREKRDALLREKKRKLEAEAKRLGL